MSDSAIPITEDMVIEWVREMYKNNDSAAIKIYELREELKLYKKALDLAIQTNDMVRNEEEYKAILLKEAGSQCNNKEWLENFLQKSREEQ